MLLAPRSNVTLVNSQVQGQVVAKTLQGSSFQITPSFLRLNNDAPPTTKLDGQRYSWSGLPLACILN
jgi:hypothetical protein